MSYFDSPSFYIDFSQLPPPEVIETIDYETILSNYKARVVAAKPSLAAALNLEQSSTNVILESEAYGEMILRARVNAAARAVMLPFATGTDLDNLAAFYNVLRLTNVDGTPESDTRFRRRVQIAAETFSTAGTEGAYIFHALTADPSIHDVSAVKLNNLGGVQISLMGDVTSPAATDAQVTNVVTYLNDIGRKVLTDVVRVSSAQVTTTNITAELTLYPGPDSGIVMNNVKAALINLRTNLGRIGYGFERSAVITALNQNGVQNVNLISPAADINPGPTGCVFIASSTVTVLAGRTF